MAFVIDFKTYLRTVKTYGPVFETFAPQLFSQSVERNKFGCILAYGRRSFDHFGMLTRRGQIFRTRLAVLLKNVLHFFINKATVGSDNGMRQVPILHFARIIHLEDDGISQLIFVLPE